MDVVVEDYDGHHHPEDEELRLFVLKPRLELRHLQHLLADLGHDAQHLRRDVLTGKRRGVAEVQLQSSIQAFSWLQTDFLKVFLLGAAVP